MVLNFRELTLNMSALSMDYFETGFSLGTATTVLHLTP